MSDILISLFLGFIPEISYFTLFLIFTKGIKEKRIKLAICIAVTYFLCINVRQYEYLYYFAFIGLMFGILKLLYKKETQIIDVFIISIPIFYITLLSFLNLLIKEDYSNYPIILCMNRILLFVPFIFRKMFNKFYITYKRWWNRDREGKNPIKSITLRNISLIFFNILIFIINFLCLYMIEK